MQRLAIIDLGSNSVRMVIMHIQTNGAYKMIEQAKVIVKLSEKMGSEKKLKREPIERTIKTLELFKKLMKVHQTEIVYPMATAAVRSATNQKEFLKEVKKKTGFEFRVLTGKEEAYYDYLGVINTMAIKDFLMIDTGGGSTEIAYIKNRKIHKSISIPYGAVLLSEKYFPNGEVESEALKNAKEEIEESISKIKWMDNCKELPIIGLGGTLRTFAKIDKKEKEMPIEKIHGYQMTGDEMNDYIKEFWSRSLKERKELDGLGGDRADIIIGGILPIYQILKKTESKQIHISHYGLREGVFFERYLEVIGESQKFVENVVDFSLNNLVFNYEGDIIHNAHISRLSLILFDALVKEFSWNSNDRKLLKYAAKLHDIGMYIDYYNHHQHSFYLTLNSELNGLEHKDLVKCALICGRHRWDRKLKINWKDYKDYINKKDNEKINQIATLLAIAEKLDRDESGAISMIKCITTKEDLIINTISLEDVTLETSAALRTGELVKKHLNKNLKIISLNEISRKDD